MLFKRVHRTDSTRRRCIKSHDPALLEALGAIESQVAALDKKVREIVRLSKPSYIFFSWSFALPGSEVVASELRKSASTVAPSSEAGTGRPK